MKHELHALQRERRRAQERERLRVEQFTRKEQASKRTTARLGAQAAAAQHSLDITARTLGEWLHGVVVVVVVLLLLLRRLLTTTTTTLTSPSPPPHYYGRRVAPPRLLKWRPRLARH